MNSIGKVFCDRLDVLTNNNKPRCVVAFSGGVDSLALLVLTVKALGKEKVVPVYVNHNIRSKDELQKEIKLNKENCNNLGLSLVVREIDKTIIQQLSKKVGIEAAARKKRYEILEEERITNNCSFILTAHHKNDQIETVVMKLLGNAPVTSCRGISERWNNVLRPLLNFYKAQLEEYVSGLGLKYSIDSTNSDNSYKRNEIRNVIAPKFKEAMPFYEDWVLEIREHAVEQCKEIEQVYDRIKLDTFNSYNEAQKMMALYAMWDNVVGTRLPQTLQKRVISGQRKASANGGTFYSYNGMLYLVNNLDIKCSKDFCVKFDFEKEKTEMPFNLFIQRTMDGKDTDLSLDPKLFKGHIYLRFPVEGEQILLKGGKKTVNKLLQDMKVPSVFRSIVPVLADDDGLCVVFGSAFGGKDRICDKLRSPLALMNHCKYICYQGK